MKCMIISNYCAKIDLYILLNKMNVKLSQLKKFIWNCFLPGSPQSETNLDDPSYQVEVCWRENNFCVIIEMGMLWSKVGRLRNVKYVQTSLPYYPPFPRIMPPPLRVACGSRSGNTCTLTHHGKIQKVRLYAYINYSYEIFFFV